MYTVNKLKETWGWTTFSGIPEPLESPYRSNIPALYGNPCHYKFGESIGEYIKKK